jgi:alpha-beta hydrolase superfamily lysophospholipase
VIQGESFLSPFTAGDGENIAIHDWPLPDVWPDQDIAGTVIIVHGLGDHAFRYGHVARFLNDQGYHVRAYDQYGHGESGGSRGSLPQAMRLVDDLADVVDNTRRSMHRGQSLILLGHSMGGVVVASFARQQLRPIDGIILSSPALDPGLNAVQKFMLATLPRFVPNLRVDNGLKVDKLCRDPQVVRDYKRDHFVHRKVSSRMAKFIADEGANIIAAAPKWLTPTLLLYAGQDALVSPAGSRAFAVAAPTSSVQSHCFEAMYHEIFNDPDRAQVFEHMQAWLKQMES